MNQRMSNKLHRETKRDIVVVGASAGGVGALKVLLAGLPLTFPAAIFVVLHLSADSPGQLPLILNRAGALSAAHAEDGESIHAGRIYVAPADRHLMIEGDRIRITRGPKENFSRPCINTLFRSAAVSFGQRVIGIVLTGMLDDGTAGLWAIKDRGGMVLVQSPEDADYPSMPISAIEHVRVDAVLPVAEMGEMLVRWTSAWIEPEGGLPMPTNIELENQIALEENALKVGILTLGPPSAYTCPECHGVMVQIQEETIVRFRCHTGHAYSIQSLLSEINESIDANLWSSIRVIEERILLLRLMEQLAREKHNEEVALQCASLEKMAVKQTEQLRKLVLSSVDLGHEVAKP